tara:strand:+ start:3978 stop:4976 length:999 start_codon:yes stop_codon:yes gene_type:complete
MNFDLSGKKVFVTGADGFIGSHLVEKLVASGADVKALVYYNSWNQIGWLNDVNTEIINSIEIVNGDVRDAHFITQAQKKSNYIFHLSSLIGIPYSYVAPQSYIETNILGALNIVQGAMENNAIERILHVSTSEVYGSAQKLPMDENHPLVGQSPYSATKIGADKIVESFYLSFGLPSVTARPFNTFGPRQTARAVIPTIINQAMNSKEINLGNLDAKRDFNYVSDTINGMIALILCKEAEGETVNIGSGEYFSIQEVVEKVSLILSKEIEVKEDQQRIRPEKSEVNALLCDNSKIKRLTNWQYEHDLDRGLSETIQWIEKNEKYFNNSNYEI